MNNNDKIDVIEALMVLKNVCHKNNKEAGWWIDPATGENVADNPYAFSNKIALVHSELSEALEADRKDLMDDKLPHRKGRDVELADALIRIFDMCGGFDIDIAQAFVEKLEFNSSRPDHKKENRLAAGGKSY